MKKSVLITMIILIILVLSMGGYLVYDKLIAKDEISNENKEEKIEEVIKEIDINSDIVKNLVYPKNNSVIYSTYPNDILGSSYSNFVLKDEHIELYSLDTKIAASFVNSKYDDNYVECYYYGDIFSFEEEENLTLGSCKKYSENIIKKDYHAMFGPDAKYESRNLNPAFCGAPKYYDSETQSYYGVQACGGAGYESFKPITKTYKAELDGENLYVYDYAMINYIYSHVDNGTLSLLFDDYEAYNNYKNSNSENYAIAKVSSEEEAESKLEELISNGTANTYVWTFKKQSDGNYYYYSSNWQNN